MSNRQLILDTETTGLAPEDGHRIIEFAALEVVNRKLTGNKLHIYINPEREIDAGATKIHGITNEQVEHAPSFKDLASDLHGLSSCALVGRHLYWLEPEYSPSR